MREFEKEVTGLRWKGTDSPWRIRARTCDKCGKRVDVEENPMEFEEFLHWEHDCGYASIFGDGSGIELDLCQDCIDELLSPYMRVTTI